MLPNPAVSIHYSHCELRMSPRAVRLTTYALLHFGVTTSAVVGSWVVTIASFGLAGALGSFPICTSALGTLWLIVGAYPSWWLSYRLAPLMVTSLPCPRCGFRTDPVSIWSAGS